MTSALVRSGRSLDVDVKSIGLLEFPRMSARPNAESCCVVGKESAFDAMFLIEERDAQ